MTTLADTADWCPICDCRYYVGDPIAPHILGWSHVACVRGAR